jgi:hypothetical protein
MATSLTLQNDASLAQGYVKVNGTTSATFTTTGITGNLTGNVTGNVTGNLTGNVTGSLTAGGSLTLATAQTASGTSVDFTSIPSWVKRITVMFNGVSTSGTSAPRIRLGTSGGFVTSGYSGSCLGITNAAFANVAFSSGFDINDGATAAATRNGLFILQSIDSNNNWVISGNLSQGNTIASSVIAGSVSAGGALTQLRITTVNGTDTFDAGTINISYEG